MSDGLNDAPTTDVEDAILPDDTTTESSTDDDAIVVEDEAEEPAPAEDEKPSEDEAEKQESDDDSAEESTEDEAETDPADDPKERARQAYLDRQAMKAQRQDEYANQLRELASQELQQIDDTTQREIAELKVKDYVRTVQEARTGLVIDNELAQRDFDVFNPKSENFNETAYTEFLKDYEAAYVAKDSNGEVIGTRGPSLYQYLSSKAELISSLAQHGARTERKAEAKMRAVAETPPVSAPKEKKKDSFLEGFEAEF